MTITNDEEFRRCNRAVDAILRKGAALGGPDLLPEADKAELTRLGDAIYEWEKVHYPIAAPKTERMASEMRRRMEEKQLTQREAARLMGVPESRVSELMSGKRRLTLAFAKRLRDVLGIPADTLLDWA